MDFDGLITTEQGGYRSVVGFTGKDLKCEGCGESTDKLLETEDSVFLCGPCYEACSEEKGGD